jgi:excisionase family DNA binding protein
MAVQLRDLARALVDAGLAEEKPGYGHATGEQIAIWLADHYVVDVRSTSEPRTPPPDQADLTVVEVASILGCSTRTVERLKTSGELGFVKIGRQTRFTRAHVAAYIDTLRVEHGSRARA